MSSTKIQGKFYPLQHQELLHLNRILTQSELSVYLWLKTNDPFGEKPIEADTQEIADELRISRRTVQRALVKLQHENQIALVINKFKYQMKSKPALESDNSATIEDKSTAATSTSPGDMEIVSATPGSSRRHEDRLNDTHVAKVTPMSPSSPETQSLINLTPIRGDRLRQHRAGLCSLTVEEINSLVSIVEIAVQLPLYLNENRGITVSALASESRQIKSREGKLGLVIVDYLQMMAADTGGNRSYELGDVARGLYKLAGDLNVPILALSQVNRGVESRQNKRPMMSDLSQSGILEMVADNIIFAYRDEYYNRDTSKQGLLELILAKARHGDTGTVEVLFDKSSGLIRSLAEFA